MRLKLTGALVLKEAILSCPDGRGISSNTRYRHPGGSESMDRRESRPGLTLAIALKEPDPAEFLSALEYLAVPPGTSLVPLNKRPELVRLVVGLRGLYKQVTAEGVSGLLTQADGPRDLSAVQTWCRRIGAEQVVRYLRDAVALFPSGKLPTSEVRREAWVGRLSRLSPDPLRELDHRHHAALEEMAECLRAYIQDHRAKFETAFAKPIPSSPDVINVLETALARTDEGVAKALKEGKKLARKADERRRILGIAEAFASGDDPRLIGFLDEITALTPSHWRTVVERRAARPQLFQRALEEASAVALDVTFPNRVYPRAEAERRRNQGKRARERIDSIISGLSDPNLRNQVKYAILQTLHVFYAYDELMVSKKGERSVKNLLSAFEGFITRP